MVVDLRWEGAVTYHLEEGHKFVTAYCNGGEGATK